MGKITEFSEADNQYNVDNVRVSAEFFGHVLLQWASIISLVYLAFLRPYKLSAITKIWSGYLLSQVFVCTMAYMRLEVAQNYAGEWREQLIWYLWRIPVSSLGFHLFWMGIRFRRGRGRAYNIELSFCNICTGHVMEMIILPSYLVIYILIGFSIWLISWDWVDRFMFFNLILMISFTTYEYWLFIPAMIEQDELLDKHGKRVNLRNRWVTLINTISFILFNIMFIINGRGWVGIAQRLIGGIWYFHNTYAFTHLDCMPILGGDGIDPERNTMRSLPDIHTKHNSAAKTIDSVTSSPGINPNVSISTV